MKPTRLFVSLCVLIVAIGLATLILFHLSKKQAPPFQGEIADKNNPPSRTHIHVPTDKHIDDTSADPDHLGDTGNAEHKPNIIKTTTGITDTGAKQTTTVTYENGITTTTTVTEYPDGLVDTHSEWVPDHPGIRSPQDLAIEEEIELAEQWLALYDKDSNVSGVMRGQNGKFYPLYDDTVYITRSERTTETGNVVYTGHGAKGDVDFESLTEIPAGKRVIELDKKGNTIADYIANGDPWQYILARGLDPLVYFYGEETAEFMAEYLNSTVSAGLQGHPTEGVEKDRVLAPGVDTTVRQDSTTTSPPEPPPVLRERIQATGFQQFDDVMQRLQAADSEMAWRERYFPDISIPEEPTATMKVPEDAIPVPNADEDFPK